MIITEYTGSPPNSFIPNTGDYARHKHKNMKKLSVLGEAILLYL